MELVSVAVLAISGIFTSSETQLKRERRLYTITGTLMNNYGHGSDTL